MDVKAFRVLIATPKDFTDRELFTERLNFYLKDRENVTLLLGFSKAGDALCEQYTDQIERFPGGFRGMYKSMESANAAIIFDSGSGGIRNLLGELKCPVRVVKVNSPGKPDGSNDIVKRDALIEDPAKLRAPAITHPDQITAGKPRKRGSIVIEGEELVPDSKPKTKKPARTSQTVYRYDYKKLYHEAHEQWFQKEYPHAWKDGFYTPKTKVPDVNTANGMASYIIDHAGWTGNYANRINVMGRQVGGFTKTRSGKTFDDRKFIKSSTKKGTPDLDLLINGTSIKPEIKINSDTESDKQQEQAAKIKKAGGVAVVFRSIDDYFDVFYRYSTQQSSLFDSD